MQDQGDNSVISSNLTEFGVLKREGSSQGD
ncbi:hypothetical protein QE435_004917 [Rhizobium sp. SORGH_AS 787]|nr:hypothetical protein [Rhizobium sp. SORGH_AS_0787]